jgi:hypothetical protein
MKRLYMLFRVLRVTVAYWFEGMRMLLDKLACGCWQPSASPPFNFKIILIRFEFHIDVMIYVSRITVKRPSLHKEG